MCSIMLINWQTLADTISARTHYFCFISLYMLTYILFIHRQTFIIKYLMAGYEKKL